MSTMRIMLITKCSRPYSFAARLLLLFREQARGLTDAIGNREYSGTANDQTCNGFKSFHI